MKGAVAGCFLMFGAICGAQVKAPSTSTPVTVPAVIDHNRVIVDADISVPGGSAQNVHLWIDNGSADLEMSRHLATLLGLPVSCDDHGCTSPPPRDIAIGGMSIPLSDLKEAHIPLKPVSAASVLAPGMNVEINLPATILRHYDVLVDFPGHKFTIGPPGSIHFQGSSAKTQINPDNGLIQIPAQIEKSKFNLALDLGSCISFLFPDLFEKLSAAHADWPQITGAVGPANMWGAQDEATWKGMRVDRVQYGSLFLTDVAVAEFPKGWTDFFQKRAGIPTAGLLGSQVFLNYRVGLDYAHSTVYFDIGRLFKFPDFDVVGVVLHPEDDGRFTILGVADLEGKPSVDGVQPGDHLVAVDGIPVRGSTMGQVWAMLGGTPGQPRRLTLERGGKEITVVGNVRHLLPEVPDESEKKKRK